MKAIDECVKDTVEAAKANDYEVIIIADHGNADHALNEDGTPNTAHSLNPVPFVYVTENKNAKVENGVLADVAPSILHILGMPQPADMTGRDLINNVGSIFICHSEQGEESVMKHGFATLFGMTF